MSGVRIRVGEKTAVYIIIVSNLNFFLLARQFWKVIFGAIAITDIPILTILSNLSILTFQIHDHNHCHQAQWRKQVSNQPRFEAELHVLREVLFVVSVDGKINTNQFKLTLTVQYNYYASNAS